MIKTLIKSLREFKTASLLSLLLMVGEVFFEVLIPFNTADMVNGIKAGEPMADVVKTGIMLLFMALASLTCGGLGAFTSAKASAGFARNLRRDIFTRVQGFSFENIDKFSTASLVTRMTTDVTNVQMAFMMIIRIAVRAPLMFAFAIVMAYIMGGSLATTFVIVVPVLIFGLLMIARFPGCVQQVRQAQRIHRRERESNAGGKGLHPRGVREEEICRCLSGHLRRLYQS